MTSCAVTIICGTRCSARTERLDKIFLQASPGEALLIVPNHTYARAREEHLVLNYNLPGLWGNVVLPFHELALQILQETCFPIVTDDSERFLILTAAIATVQQQIDNKDWEQILALPGFAEHVQLIIEQLKQAAMEPQNFLASAKNRENFDHSYDALVAAIYEEYQKSLQDKGLYDRIGVLWAAADRCAHEKARLFENVTRLIFDGFDDFTLSELRLIEQLAKHVPAMVFGINCDPQSPNSELYDLQNRTVQLLQKRLHATVEKEETPSPESYSTYVALNLLNMEAQPAPPAYEKNLLVTTCSNVLDELEFVAREVKALLYYKKAAINEIAVVFTDLPHIIPMVRAVFDSVGVPISEVYKPTVGETLIGTFIQHLLNTLVEDWARDPAALFLSSPFISTDEVFAKEGRTLIHTLATLAGIVSSLEEWIDGIERLYMWVSESNQENDVPKLLSRIPNATAFLKKFQNFLCAIKNIVSEFPEKGSLSEFANSLTHILNFFQLQNQLQNHYSDTEQQAFAKINQLLWKLRQGCLPSCFSSTMTRAQFSNFFCTLLKKIQIPQDVNQQGILVCPPSYVRNLRFSYVYFCGVNEGQLPAPPHISAIYNEDDIQDFRTQGLNLETTRESVLRQRTIFQHVLLAATKFIHITWRAMAPDGREMRRSPFLLEILNLLPDENIQQCRLQADSPIPNPDEIWSPRDLAVTAIVYQLPVPDHFVAKITPIARGLAVEQQRNKPTPFDEYDGVLSSQDMLALLNERFGETHVFSANQIEEYLRCPFYFFVKRLLNIEEIETFLENLETAERGKFLHHLLREFHQKYYKIPLSKIENAKQNLLDLFEELMQKIAQRIPPSFQGRWIAESRIRKRILERYIYFYQNNSEEECWEPTWFELEFGYQKNAKSHPPFVLETPIGKLRFCGRIDRIDESSEGLRVIDYKVGTVPTLKSIQDGKSIQLPLYVLATEYLKLSDKPCIQARYLGLRETHHNNYIRQDKPENWETCFDAMKNSVAKVVEYFRNGYFPPRPEKDVCSGCSAQNSCRYDENRIERKLKANTP